MLIEVEPEEVDVYSQAVLESYYSSLCEINSFGIITMSVKKRELIVLPTLTHFHCLCS